MRHCDVQQKVWGFLCYFIGRKKAEIIMFHCQRLRKNNICDSKERDDTVLQTEL